MPRRSVRSRRRTLGGFLSFLIGALTVSAVILAVAIVLTRRYKPAVTQPAPTDDGGGGSYVDMKDLPETDLVLKADSFSDEYLPTGPAGTPTPDPGRATSTPAPMATLASGVSADTEAAPTPAAEGMLPVYRKGSTDQKLIAITLDECGSIKLMNAFINMAKHFDAKITLFPTGENIMKAGMGDVLKTCVQQGHEIENRGYNGRTKLYQCADTMMVQQIWKQSVALNYVLGVKYQPHFYRMAGGRGENDPRTHAFLKQQGYEGIAHWTMDASNMELEKLVDKLTPGGVYVFKCSEADGRLMYALMTAARDQGYRMVTLNQLFGLPENSRTAAGSELLSEKMPDFEYDNPLYDLMPGDEAWAVMLMQQRLMTLGYLPAKGADGIFGNDTSTALRAFQAKVGILASGIGDVTTQEQLYSKNAPINDIPLIELFPSLKPTQAPQGLPGTSDAAPRQEESLVASSDFADAGAPDSDEN